MPKTIKELEISKLTRKVKKKAEKNSPINPEFLAINLPFNLNKRKSKGKRRKLNKRKTYNKRRTLIKEKQLIKEDKNIYFIYIIVNKIYIFLFGTLRVP